MTSCFSCRKKEKPVRKLTYQDQDKMASKKSKKAHVTFGDSKRILSYEKGEDVQELRLLFLRVFSDMLSDDVAPSNVKFQLYDESFKDYVDLGSGIKLEENAKMKAITVPTQGKKVHGCCTGITEAQDCSHVHHHCVIPMYDLVHATPPGTKLHPIKKNVPYRFWSPVSKGLVETDVSDPQKVTASGNFVNSVNTVIQPISSTPSDSSEFEPDYYWGQTMFKSNLSSTLYLGTDRDGKATLVPMADPSYPNPKALFIVNKI
ncbi:hypothetical protein OS493_011215 [Desmophyllum pertusum]|uniref:Uncharacterized protein n=1 Tax=Desmophyllum pertusum TaxID=174260 RepID=A0A9W9Z240_9CNID|nr:hypothetical protein OS493_011215 [Desmophyllum pertusum]